LLIEKESNVKLSFKLANLIFAKEEIFTVSELKEELDEEGIEKSEEEIKSVLDRLRENGLVVKHDSTYSACL